jgi:hypothetical protein
MRTLLSACALAIAVFSTACVAQTTRPASPTRPGSPGGEAIIYRDRNFSGPAVNVSQAEPNLGLAWRVNSIRLVRGSMELCSEPRFRGRCVTATRSFTDISSLGLPGNRVQSMRPTSGNVGGNVGGPPPTGGSALGPSLRGMSATFFTQPSRNGRRIPACGNASATAACAAQSAAQFCRTQGYNFVGNVRQQTVSGRAFLADVLCRNSAS